MTLLTIIIPTYNRSALLSRTLSSLVVQSRQDFLVVVVDHGSTDDTKALAKSFRPQLHLDYYCILRARDDPGFPRDFGVRRTTTPLITFLDCGIVVPTYYVDAHIRFHQQYEHTVGFGLYHGHKITSIQDNRWNDILVQVEQIDQASEFFPQDRSLRDHRAGARLENVPHFTWLYAWSGNMSMTTEDYWTVGGFDREFIYGFEDCDLCYRMFKCDIQFRLVEEGWGIHLPHVRASLEKAKELEYNGWQISYHKYRSLILETVQYAGMNPKTATLAFEYLTQLGQHYQTFPSVPEQIRFQCAHPTLLIGATLDDAPFYDYIAVANEDVSSSDSIWSSSGILHPLPDNTLRTVVVSDLWKWLDVSFHPSSKSLLECLIAEVKRTAQQALFMHTPLLQYRDREPASVEKLSNLCSKYDLSFKVCLLTSFNGYLDLSSHSSAIH
jgi:glycosyltransferase involved in cell wall biosynthesis